MMEIFILYAVICFGQDAATNCQAYELDYNLSEVDCDHYFTDSGLVMAENLLSIYVPNYVTGENQVILSCEPKGISNE